MGRKSCSAGCILLFVILGIVPSVRAQSLEQNFEQTFENAFQAEVVRVKRGDRLTVRHLGKSVELALYGIRCPAPGEPHGNEARAFTSRAALHKKVGVQIRQGEEGPAIVASVVLPDGSVLNHRLVQNGLASWNRRSAPNEIKLQTLEDSARDLRLGVWASSSAQTADPIPKEQEPRPIPSRRSEAPAWRTIFATFLALLVTAAMVVFFAFQRRRPRDKEQAAPPPDRTGAPEEVRSSDEQARAVESGRHAIQDLLLSLSEFVSGLMESNVSYNSKMKDHKVSIDKATTLAGLEQIRRLLVHEIEEMQSTSENYRLELEHANATIRDQQEILERFRIDAKMDFLTQIANRRAFETRLKEEFERARRYKGVFALIMIDIDHFKKVNDDYGHMAGDQILRLIAQVLEDQTRLNDFVSRYGGEEFAVLLPESTADQGRCVAEKILRAVENTSLLHENSKLKVTVSAGVGEVDTENDTPETLLQRVDVALYQAKKNGRNRVETASD